MKKYINIVLAMVVVFGLSGCTEEEDAVNSSSANTMYSLNSLVDVAIPTRITAYVDHNLSFTTSDSNITITNYGGIPTDVYQDGNFTWNDINDSYLGTHNVIFSDGNNSQTMVLTISDLSNLVSGDSPITDPGSFSFSTTRSWLSDYGYSTEGSKSSKTSDIGNNESICAETNVDGSGVLRFDWKVSSESGYDYLRFYVDGGTVYSISGSVDWEAKTYTQDSDGTHTYKWCYSKDGSVSGGDDAGWLDNIRFDRN